MKTEYFCQICGVTYTENPDEHFHSEIRVSEGFGYPPVRVGSKKMRFTKDEDI